MTAQDTSIEAYYLISVHELSDREREVFEAFKTIGPMNNREMSLLLARPINTITPTTFRLREAGLVVESHRDVDPETHRRVIYWKAA